MRGLEPAAGELALGQVCRQLALALAHRAHRHVGADVLEDDDPVGVVLVDRGEEVEHDRAGDQQVLRQRLAQIAQPLRSGWSASAASARRRRAAALSSTLDGVNGSARQPLPAIEIELGPLRLRQRPVVGGAPFIRAHHPELHRRLAMMPVSMPLSQWSCQRRISWWKEWNGRSRCAGPVNISFFGAVMLAK